MFLNKLHTYLGFGKDLAKRILVFGCVAIGFVQSAWSNHQPGFVRNDGQIHDQQGKANYHVQFMGIADGMRIQLKSHGFSYEVQHRKATAERIDSILIHRVDFDFSGQRGKGNAWMATSEPIAHSNYYNQLGSFPEVPHYSKVVYKEAWPGIDVHFSWSATSGFKYEFVIKEPKQGLKNLSMRVQGSKSLSLAENGKKLLIETSLGVISDDLPYSYYACNGPNRPAIVKWQIRPNGEVGFQTESYPNCQLHIDPVPILRWSTYYGGSGNDQGYGVATNSAGDAYFCGRTTSSSLATSGVFQGSFGGGNFDDAFLVKMKKEGGTGGRVWATYYGGDSTDVGFAVTVSKDNFIYLTGHTNSSRNASRLLYRNRVQTSHGGKLDAFIAKFDDNGRLIWSNFFGGSEDETAYSVSTDRNNRPCIVGVSYSDDTSLVHRAASGYSVSQSAYAGNGDGFVLYLDTAGSRLFSTYWGGTGTDILYDVVFGLRDTLYTVGKTKSSGLSNSLNSISSGFDGYATAFRNSGALIRNYYFGGGGDDQILSIIADSTSLAFAGTTNSDRLTALSSGHQGSLNQGNTSSNTDAFLLKTNLQFRTTWGTYYGGDNNDYGTSLDRDINNYLYLTGYTESKSATNTAIATKNALQEEKDGGKDAYVVKFNSSGTRVWGTYFGRSEEEYSYGIAHGIAGDVFIVGETNSDSNFVKNAFQSRYGSSYDAFFIDINYCHKYLRAKHDTACLNDSITLYVAIDSSLFVPGYKFKAADWRKRFPAGYSVRWTGPRSFSSTLQFPRIKSTLSDTGLYRVIVTNEFGCTDTAFVRLNTFLPGSKLSITAAKKHFCKGDTIQATASSPSGKTYAWSGPGGFSQTGKNLKRFPASLPAHTGMYRVLVVDSNNCRSQDSMRLTVGPEYRIVYDAMVCFHDTIQFAVTPQNLASVSCTGPRSFSGSGNLIRILMADSSRSGTYTFIVRDSSGCRDTSRLQLRVKPPIRLTFSGKSVYCQGQTTAFSFRPAGIFYPARYQWTGPASYSGTDSIVSLAGIASTRAGRYNLRVTGADGCFKDTFVDIEVKALPQVSFTADSLQTCLDGNRVRLTSTSSLASGSGSISSYLWTLGDGNSNFGAGPFAHRYTASGSYTVKLVVTSSFGCKDSASRSISIHPEPVASFTINNKRQCLRSNSFVFTNRSAIASGSMSYSWNFGDGSGTTATNPSKTYSNAGRYTVRLISVSGNGCRDTITDTVRVLAQPTAAISINNNGQCLDYNRFVFRSTSTVTGDSITGHNWSFGGGFVSNSRSDTIHYRDTGSFSIRLIVTTRSGCRDTANSRVTVYPQGTADFTVAANPQCLRGNNFAFSDNSRVGSGSINGYNWTFGNGNTSTLRNPSGIVYNAAGTYNVRLITRTSNQCLDTQTRTVTVKAHPVARTTVNNDTQCLSGNRFTFGSSASSAASGSSLASWRWTFGTGASRGSDTNQTPAAIVYSSTGLKPVSLVLTDANGCRDTARFNVFVEAMPVAGFSLGSTAQCLRGNSFSITNTSTGARSYLWDFGDGTSSSSTSPSKTYSSAGTYTIRLIALSFSGCRDTVSRTVTVYTQPLASFTLNNNAQCLRGNRFTTSNNSTGAGSYNWSFGDGSSSSATAPDKTYTAAGSYNIRLRVTTANGCVDSLTRAVNVFANPTAAFTLNNNTQCVRGNNFTTSNTSSGASSYTWDFGDGFTSTGTSPSRTYAAAGTYTIRLIAITANGCRDTLSRTVAVNAQPVAAFSVNNAAQCLKGNSFVFTHSGSGGSTYSWTFGDGTSSTSGSPSKTYSAAGTYSVRLISISSAGCRDTASRTITVHPDAVAGFSLNNSAQCLRGNRFTTTNSSSGASSYEWSFGDGTSSSQSNPTKTYASAGNYTIRLIAITSNACRDTLSRTVNVYANPSADFSLNSNTQCIRGNRFTTTNTSTGASSYDWIFGDGTSSTQNNPVKSYTTAGTYNIRLIAVTSNGCRDTLTRSVTVNAGPTAGFTLNTTSSCLSRNTFLTTNTSSGAGSYTWDFGDGTSSSSTSPSKSYASAGSYTIRLIAIASNGCRDTQRSTVTVYPQPAAGFTLNTNAQCLRGNSFQTTNNSTGASSYTWDFGDGTTSTGTSPGKTYTAAGTYSIRLIAINSNGCRDTLSRSVKVNPNPTAAYTLNNATQCLRGNSFVTTNSSSGASSYSWDFGDATSSVLTSPSKTYSAAGTYAIRLIAITSAGCRDTLSRTATVNANASAAFSLNNNTQCLRGNRFTVTNSSTGAVSYEWSFGDGTTSTATSPVKGYSASGTYTIRLIAVSAAGCRDTLSRTVTVNPNPVAGFSISNSAQCLRGNSFAITNSSTGASTYNWSFGDASTSTVSAPSKTYTAAGTYAIRLIAFSANGCSDTLSRTVTVNAQPTAGFTVNNNSQCLRGNNFSFTNNSTGGNTYGWSFGDGTTSSATNPSKTYSSTGTYNVRLIAVTLNACRDTLTRTVTVKAHPVARATVNNDTQCLGGNQFVYRAGTSTPVSGSSITGWRWAYGTGASRSGDTVQSPSAVVYSTSGLRTVSLVVTDANGCRDTGLVSVFAEPNPTAAFTLASSSQCLAGNRFSFTNSSSGATTYSWSFGDGTTSSQTTPTKTYSAAGTYTISLIAISANGCRDTLSRTVTVHPQPAAGFSLNSTAQCLRGNRFTSTNNSTGASNYEWSFGDATTSTQTAPVKTYAAAGTYSIRLIAVTGNGCRDTFSRSVSVNPNPTASFSLNNSTQCLNGNRFTSTNNSTGASSYSWDFGDGTTSAASAPTKTYSAAGTYTIRLIASTANGCRDTSSRSVTVNPNPTAGFTLNNSSQCLRGNRFTTTNGSSGATGYEWSFGDGTTSTANTPVKSYSAAGTYTIRLIAVSSASCRDTLSRSVTINPNPTAGFSLNNNAQCVRGNSFNTTNSSSGASSYIWDFGDGTGSVLTAPSKTYSASGTYTMRLVAVSAAGCRDTLSRTITVHAQPVAGFTTSNNSQCLRGNSFSFSNSSSSANTYAWSFGDGTTSSSSSPTKTYAGTGTYTVRLIVASLNNCFDTLSRSMTVKPHPTARASVNLDSQCLSNNLFTYRSSGSSPVSGSSLTGWRWTFGTGASRSTDTVQSPAGVAYSGSGTKAVRLIVIDANACRDTGTLSIYIRPNPTASFTLGSSAQCLQGNSFTASNNSSGASSYNWSFGDGTSSTQTSPVKSYVTSGAYAIRLVAISSNGCRDTLSRSVTVHPQPVANFTLNNGTQCLSRNNFVTSNSSSGASTYSWDFGDGTTSTASNPTKTYTAAGTYAIRLIAITGNGCRDTLSRTVNVQASPTAAFTLNNNSQCLRGNNFTVTNSSTGANSYAWDFGDGTTASIASPSKSYTAAGSYVIRMIAISASGCRDTLTRSVTVNPNPSAAFSLNSNAQCLRGNRFVTINSSTGASTYSWSFGDATTSSSANPVKVYSSAGNYSIRLIATSTNACQDTQTRNVTVNASPTASFTLNNNTQCLLGNSFATTNNSTAASSYNWDFGDGTNASTSSPAKSYAAAGSYTVRLIAIHTNGCRDTFSRTLTVNPQPIATFGLNSNTQCIRGNNFITTNTSSGGNTYSWTFGDGSSSTASAPSKSYAATGTYTITLVASTSNGCRDTAKRTVTVNSSPTAAFTLSNNSQCLRGNSFVTTNSSTGATSYSWDFGDASSSAATSPSKTYTTANSYNIRLIAITSTGCRDTQTRSVTVHPQPAAGFSLANNSLCLRGNSFATTNNSTGANSYAWSFGDATTSTSTSPSKSYSNTGTYSIRLIASSLNNCRDTITRSVTVKPHPTARLTVNLDSQCLSSNLFTFRSATSAPVSGSSLSGWNWSFGSGASRSSDTAQSPNAVRYSTSGSKAIRLVVLDANGCRDTANSQVNVINNPTAGFTVSNNAQCLRGNSFSFSNTSSGATAYAWSFGDGTTSTASNPGKTYSSTGTFTVRLVTRNVFGCTDTITRNITVHPQPVAAFSLNSNSQCLRGNSFTTTNSSSGATSYSWSFGDGTTSTANNPTKTYSASGTYNIRLIAITGNSCRDTITRSVTVNPNPTAAFSLSSSAQCLQGNSFSVTNSSSGATSYSWSFGDGSSSTATSPTKTYSTAGTYTVRLVAFNSSGCSDTLNRNITVHPQPVAAFSLNSNSQCLNGNSFTTTNSSSGANNYSWSFGDGTSSTANNPTKTYSASGTYNIRLIAITGNSCRDTLTRSVTVNPNPTAAFSLSSSAQCLQGNSFSVTNSSSGATSYSWSFGDGSSSTATNPTKTYSTAGTYTVRLVAFNSSGCSDTLNRNITVHPQPVAAFSLNSASQCLRGNSFTTTNSSSGATNYSWSFGDGTTSTASNPTKSYSSAGTYTIRLIAITGNSCRDTLTRSVTVNPNPTASFTVSNNAQCFRGNRFVFNSTSTVSAGSLSYAWSFGGGRTSSNSHDSLTYADTGTYRVRLIAITSAGCRDTAFSNVVVYPQGTADFSIAAAAQCLRGNSFSFTDNSRVGSGSINAYDWRFGNGNTSTQRNPTGVVYASAGTYNVRLITRTSNNCRDTITRSVTVKAHPTARLTVNLDSQCLSSNLFTFRSATSAPVSGSSLSGWIWSFGSGASRSGDTVQSPNALRYSTSGSKAIRLVVLDANGCRDTANSQVNVINNPTAGFTVSNNAQCLRGNSFSFSNASSGATSYSWSFGDGTTSTASNPGKTYSSTGTFTVRLVARNAFGCTDTITRNITVHPQPVAAFSLNSTAQCLRGNSFTTTNSSSGATSYSWSFGDGTTSTAKNPSKTYSASGTYNIRLIAITGNSCRDTLTRSVTVNPNPTAAFSLSSSAQCLKGNSFGITNSSSGATSYNWTFGDGSSSTAASPTKTYSTAGTYTVRLVAFNSSGCSDTLTRNITVHPQPVAAFNLNSAAQCLRGNSFTTTNSSSGATSYSWSFGDGTTSTANNPTKTYSAAGTYNIRLIAITGNSCRDTLSRSVTVNPEPTASFTVNSTAQCFRDNRFVFNSTSTVSAGSLSYAWNFGGGKTSSNSRDSIAYADTGTYRVRLIAITSAGCRDTAFSNVVVYPQGTADFSIAAAAQCLRGNSFSFTDNSRVGSGSINGYDWSFGNGNTSTQRNPTGIVYASAGTYNVRLITRTSNNCRDTITRSVTVKPHPTARLTVNLDSQCLSSNLFTFRSATSAPVSGSSLSSWSWSFGSGASRSSDTVQSPNALRYSTSGNKAVRLIVLDANGCRDTAAHNVQVKANPQARIQAVIGISCLKGNYFAVSPRSSSGVDSASLRTFAWDFGTSAIPASLQRSQSRTDTVRFSQAGTFSVRLIVYDRNGCTDTIRESLTVHPQPAAAPGVSDTALCLANKGNLVVFTARNVSGNRYIWRFGDGNGDTASSTQYTYTAAGVYKAVSIITNRFGCKDTAEFPVRVYPDPVAQFNSSRDSLCLFGNNFSFTNRSTAGGDSIVSYLWTFGDGSSSRVKSPVNIIYNNAGRYRVGLRIGTAQGCSDSTVSNVLVLAHPNADFSVNQDTQCLNTNGFVFRQSSASVAGSYIRDYAWTFDSTASIGQFSGANPDTVVYRNHNTKLIRLIVRDNNTCRDTAYKAVLVLENPIAGWQASDTLQCLQTNRFVFASTGTRAVTGSAIARYRWHFGTGAQPDTGSLASGNVVRYSSSGIKFIKLSVTDNNGCTDEFRSYVRVEPTPVASFTLNSVKQCLNDNRFRVKNTSTSLQTTSVYEWDFGDGTVIRAKDTAHSYVNAGIYRIRLIIRHPSLCNDTFERRITVHPSPKAGITYNANCSQNLSVNLSSTSSVPVGRIVGYLWDFGSGRFAYRKDTTLSYTFPGTHTVKLKVTTDSGCTDEVSRNIVIYERVRAAFTTTRNVCGVNTNVKFTNGSRYSSGNNVKFFWDFGDNSQSSDTNGLHRYNSAGQYTVRLIVVTDDGCRDTARETIRIFDAPAAGFTLSNSCAANGLATFSNTSRILSGSMTYNWSFDDGNFSNLPSPTHKYGSFGFYNVRLIATSNNGCRDTVIQRIRINPVPAVKVKDTILNHCLRNNLFALADTVTLTSGTFTRRWILSDGTSYTQPWLRKTFADSGRFTAVSRITSDQGCVATDTAVFYVKPDPIAAFTVNDTSQCLKDNWFVFRNRSSNPGLRKSLDYYWDFGNSDTSTLENPVYKYNAYGLMPVTLQVRNSDGCVDVFKQRITVHPHPVAMIGVNDSQQCLQPNQFIFSNLSLNYSGGGALASSWTFGDSTGSNLYSPIHRYNNHGRYTVSLTVRSIHGCAADTDMVVRVWPQPDLPRIRFTRPIQCHGGLGALDASVTGGTSPYRYSWNGRAFTNASRLDSIPAGHYQLTVSDANGCENGDTFRLLQPDRLVDTIQVLRDVLCNGQSTGMANVKVNGGVGPYQLEWTLGSRTFFGSDLVRVPAGQYYLLVTDMLGCRLKDSMIIREPAKLQAKVDILRPSPCFGSTARVEAVVIGGVKPYRYFWNGVNEAGSVYDRLTAGNYFVEVRDSNGCSVVTAFTITQPVLPRVRIDSVRDVSCFGVADGRIFTTPSGGTGRIDYRWYNAGNQLVSIERNPTGMTAGSYSLLLSDSNRCRDSFPNVALIRQPAQMHVKVTRHENINCFDGNDGRIVVAAVGGNGRYNYQWQVLPLPVSDSSLASLRVGTYRVLASDRKNCRADTAITLTQRPKNPVVLANDSMFVCEKGSAILTANMNQAASFRWTDPDGKQYPWGANPLRIDSFNITKSNWYKVVGVDQFGCRDSNQVFVGVKALPIISSSAQPAVFCYNQNAALRANGAFDYRWLRFNRAFGVWDTISNARDLVFSPFQRSDTGFYLLRGTDRNGCTSSATVRVRTGLDSVIVQRDTQLCAGGLFQIRATGARFYEWQTPRGQFIQNPILSFADLQSADSGRYRLKVTDEFGCEGNYQTFVRVFKKPVVNLSDFSPGKICEDRPLRLVLNTDAERFVWTGPGLPRTQNTSTFYEIPQVGRQNQGIYKVVGTTSFGCMDSSELFVQVNPKPDAGMDIHQGCKVSLATEPLAFLPLWRGRSSSQWFIDDIKASDSAYFPHVFKLPGSYRVRHRIVSDQGCENTSEQLVNVVDAPRVWLANAFTPENGDLLNNVYKPAMTSTVLEYNMAIYDRWGGKVWEWRGANSSTLQEGSWNGRVNGTLLPPGTYVVVVDYSTVCGDDPKKLQQRISSDLTLFR